MKKEVLVSISGLQYELDNDEAVEVISAGEYYKRDGKHYITYEEMLEDMDGVSNCIIKITDQQIDMIKRGANNVHMIFAVNNKNTTFYNTPYGELQIGIYTTLIDIKEEEDKLTVDIEYSLDINYAKVSDCHIQLKVTSRKQG